MSPSTRTPATRSASAKQLRQTTKPQPGDVVVFANDTLGLGTFDDRVFVLETWKVDADEVYPARSGSSVAHEVRYGAPR